MPKSKNPGEPDVAVAPLGPDDWSVVERLFGPRGAVGGCWCMHWRVERGGKAWDAVKGEPNRRAFKTLVEAGRVHGVIAYAGDEPVGWCAFGPKADFPRLARSRMAKNSAHPDAWAVTCLFVARKWRARGIGLLLLDGAAGEAFDRGAAVLEGYPVRPRSQARMPDAFAWTGVVRMFEVAGWRECPVPEGARPLYACDHTTYPGREARIASEPGELP